MCRNRIQILFDFVFWLMHGFVFCSMFIISIYADSHTIHMFHLSTSNIARIYEEASNRWNSIMLLTMLADRSPSKCNLQLVSRVLQMIAVVSRGILAMSSLAVPKRPARANKSTMHAKCSTLGTIMSSKTAHASSAKPL
jgi:hypothetical protein